MSAMPDCYGNPLSTLRLHELSEHLYPDDYRRLGLRLGIEETRLMNIERAKCGNMQECIYQMLVDWSKHNGHGATSQVLIQSLKQIGNQSAADWLQAEIDSSLSIAPREDIDSICRRGNVPSLPDCLTERTVEIADVAMKLRELSSLSSSSSTSSSACTTATRWLVVHGLGGMGKSVLINQAIRDEQLIKECFPDGVFWLCIGAAVRGTASITERLETLCRSLDVKLLMAPSLPKTKDQWKNLLSTLIAQTYPRSLLILDDVWDQDVIRAFEVCCTVAITTRDKGLHSCASGRKEEIVLFHGFSESQSLQALSEWTKTPSCDLPQEAARIHELSHGSPLVVSIIGSLLREHGQRWEYYVTQLEERNLEKLSTVRDAIHLSVEELPSRDDAMRLFSWFAVFDQGTTLSSKILSMLEGCSAEEIEDRMKILTQRHLAVSGCHTDDKDQVFWLHDLVYDYLVSEKVANDKDVGISNEFRSLMAFNRFRACRRDMIQTSLCLPQISEVHRRARAASAARAAKNGFYVAEVVDKRPLVSSVTHTPAGKYATCAKLLPSGREILTAGYGGQVQIVDFIDGKARTIIHGHADIVTDLSVSSDGSLLATCSPTKGICVWDFSRTDCLLPHVKSITYEDSNLIRCSFVDCNGETKLVSGDTSGCLKVWSSSFSLQYSVPVGNTSLVQAPSSVMELLPGSAIISCSTCDKEGSVASCAKADNIVKVFDLQTGSPKFEIVHDADVLDCSYLSNGLIITLTWCLLHVYNARGRQLSCWTDRGGNVNFCNLSCAQGKDGYYIAVRGFAGVITVLHLGKMFPVTRRLTVYYRLNVGGVYRDVNNMWMECINTGNGACGNYLVTNQSCGLILVWKLEKVGTRPQIDGTTFDVSFKTDGSIRALIGKKPRSSRKCLMLQCCGKNMITNKPTAVYKTRKFETIDSIEMSPGHYSDIISCTSTRVKVSPLPGCVTRQPKRKEVSTALKEFSVVPSQDKMILATFIDSHHLLTVSSGTHVVVECWSRSGSSTASRHIEFQQGLSADLSHDHKKLAVGCSNRTVFLLKLTGCSIDEGDPSILKVEGFRVTGCVFSPNDKLLAVSGDRQVTVFDVDSCTQLAKCSHKRTISSIRFTPDSEMLLIVAHGSLILCESRTLCKRSRRIAFAVVSDYHFSSDGTMLVTAGAVRYFDKGYLEWWRIDKSGSISELQKFMINSRIKRVVCNQYFTVFVTVDEVDEIYVLQRIAPSEGHHDNGRN